MSFPRLSLTALRVVGKFLSIDSEVLRLSTSRPQWQRVANESSAEKLVTRPRRDANLQNMYNLPSTASSYLSPYSFGSGVPTRLNLSLTHITHTPSPPPFSHTPTSSHHVLLNPPNRHPPPRPQLHSPRLPRHLETHNIHRSHLDRANMGPALSHHTPPLRPAALARAPRRVPRSHLGRNAHLPPRRMAHRYT